jgi:hypothetical protein
MSQPMSLAAGRTALACYEHLSRVTAQTSCRRRRPVLFLDHREPRLALLLGQVHHGDVMDGPLDGPGQPVQVVDFGDLVVTRPRDRATQRGGRLRAFVTRKRGNAASPGFLRKLPISPTPYRRSSSQNNLTRTLGIDLRVWGALSTKVLLIALVTPSTVGCAT